MVACRILMESISAALASAIHQAFASLMMMSKSSSRTLALNFLESFNPTMGRFGSSITAAATTDPAKGPLPASSTPQIHSIESGMRILNHLSDHFCN